ncbi:MAG TPA: glycosyltransferase [Prolixibacteraceae bacterium]|jgi:glycosyltransferase involved in cell wall biosynthesis
MMKTKTETHQRADGSNRLKEVFGFENIATRAMTFSRRKEKMKTEAGKALPELLVITSYPPRECGIATYSQDLIQALNHKFDQSFTIKVCALEAEDSSFDYPPEVKFKLKTSVSTDYHRIARLINQNNNIKIVLIQHEFGLFYAQEEAYLQFIHEITKPIVAVFHTVLPRPDEAFREKVQHIMEACQSVVVMTHNSAELLINDYDVAEEKIVVIAHGTHLVQHLDEVFLKNKYGLADRKVLTTFGLLSRGKGIETTLDALPEIIKTNPEIMFLVIGATHPEVVKKEGEVYRRKLEAQVEKNGLTQHVKFINRYLALSELLEYLQLTDIYVFSSNDPNQAVSGTFAYAMSCGCPIISTPIPHAKEVLTKDTGVIFDFNNSIQLAEAVTKLFSDDSLRKNMIKNTLQKVFATSWENSAIAHASLLKKIGGLKLHYNLPEVNLDHLKRLTTNFGMIQFSNISQPDLDSGYTLDDNARALIAICMDYELTAHETDLKYLQIYLDFIKYCQLMDGGFLNYVDKDKRFTQQNYSVNLEDSNGRAIWALGFLISKKAILPSTMVTMAESILNRAMPQLLTIYSTRAMAFAIKGMYYYNMGIKSPKAIMIIKILANRLVQMYKHESEKKWEWFEPYLTYANSVLPEALLCAGQVTGDILYKEIARESFDFLLSSIFNEQGIEVISNKRWLFKGEVPVKYGEQPIDVAYTILALNKFNEVFNNPDYSEKLTIAFNWFLGQNRLDQIIYNPCTGGCYDGMEENHVNPNQGAESTVSYLMARMTIAKFNLTQPTRMYREEQVRRVTPHWKSTPANRQ